MNKLSKIDLNLLAYIGGVQYAKWCKANNQEVVVEVDGNFFNVVEFVDKYHETYDGQDVKNKPFPPEERDFYQRVFNKISEYSTRDKEYTRTIEEEEE